MKPLSVYIHIPFCIKKCLYCDFLSAPADEKSQLLYIAALCREIKEESISYVNHTVTTVFIGGGTPSSVPAKGIADILGMLRENYRLAEECEISMEVNPGTVTEEKLSAWKKAGINRLSIGLQSLVDQELEALGRIHNSSDFFETYGQAVKTGFDNINVDLMSGIPRQTLESWQRALRCVAELEPAPKHISAYSLIVEEGTPFYEHTPQLPDEDTEREMYKITNDILKTYGYHRYEISNYAKAGYECRHNQVYWRRGEYVGFGIGAASLIDNVRFSNIKDIKNYVNHFLPCESNGEKDKSYVNQMQADILHEDDSVQTVRENITPLSRDEQIEEFMFLGLRLMRGVSEKEFTDVFGEKVDEIYPGLVDKFVGEGLMKRLPDEKNEDTRLALTDRGIDVSNCVMAEFLLT